MAQYIRRSSARDESRRHSVVWVLQAASGVLLVVLVVSHMLAQHFTTAKILSYADVVSYLSNPGVFSLETLLLVSVTFHALAGVRAIALDLGLSQEQDRRLTRTLWVAGIIIVAYGVGLTLYIITTA